MLNHSFFPHKLLLFLFTVGGHQSCVLVHEKTALCVIFVWFVSLRSLWWCLCRLFDCCYYWFILILENKSDKNFGHFESVGLKTPSRLWTPWQTYWRITQYYFFLQICSCVERSLWIKAVNSKQTETVCSVSRSSILYVSLSAVMHNRVVFGRQTCSTESTRRENVGLYTLHVDS